MPSFRTRSATWRRTAAALLAAAAVAGAAACAPSPGPTTAPSSAADSVQLLGRLTVATAGSMRGYSRSRFPHWRETGENCDVRDTVLKRDGRDVRLRGCNVVGGRWVSVYDDRTLSDPSQVDIDHVVPLANAWRSGAADWDDQRRGEFANDLTRPQLIAVSATSNRAKGDQDPSQWKPPNRDYWCTYAEHWIAVKHHWRLSVTSAEKATLTDMLETCSWAKRP
ncbi:Protein of unknown function [Micromonospora pattaloongensis]|uniref:GmrSD restriction endonucleases C-terminal domain-containing protein n=1 Tax=Micromonospora pattaloongensis TaxID=405436 RepID=A0A1H3HFY0_9ACTN|nr:HNH endonuclease family protein [Micromonospora pattaloongensis]SDY13738.1 Protein of unknown function [Micromonospora pattaloongensis]